MVGGAYNRDAAHQRMKQSFTEVVSGAREPWISTVECLRTVAAVEAAYRSLHTDSWEWVETHGVRGRRTATGA
jgi:hypothetical protein